MAKQSKVSDLVGYAGVAEILGVKVKSVYQYRWRDDQFPEPELDGRSPVWLRRDIEAYKRVREGRPSGWAAVRERKVKRNGQEED